MLLPGIIISKGILSVELPVYYNLPNLLKIVNSVQVALHQVQL